MDLNGRNPQPGQRPDINNPLARPQQYANTPTSRPSLDGMSPLPQPTPQMPPSALTNDHPQSSVNNEPPQVAQPQVLEPTHHSSSKPVILAIITLLVAGALAVTAFFAFRPETADKVNKVNTPTPSQSQPSTTTVNEQVDNATNDINKQVDGLNDTQDFSDTELSDQSLGL